jgi:MoxR-like ATPase
MKSTEHHKNTGRFEAMQERSVTIAGENYKLDLPYFVLATQNPIEQEGTYPEAQLDRFMFAIKLEYLFAEEVQVVKRTTSDEINTINSLFTAGNYRFSAIDS